MSSKIATRIKLLPAAIFQLLSGALGWRLALTVYLQVALQIVIAVSHTQAGAAARAIFALTLLAAQGVAAQLTVSLFNHAANIKQAGRRPSPNKVTWQSMSLSALVVVALSGLSVFLLQHLVRTSALTDLLLSEGLISALQARYLLRTISGLYIKKV